MRIYDNYSFSCVYYSDINIKSRYGVGIMNPLGIHIKKVLNVGMVMDGPGIYDFMDLTDMNRKRYLTTLIYDPRPQFVFQSFFFSLRFST